MPRRDPLQSKHAREFVLALSTRARAKTTACVKLQRNRSLRGGPSEKSLLHNVQWALFIFQDVQRRAYQALPDLQ